MLRPEIMLRPLVPVLICLIVGWLVFIGGSRRSLGQATGAAADEDRVAKARTKVEAQARTLMAENGLTYPPRQVFLRAFKFEQVLELWAGGKEGPLKLLRTYPLTANSGGPGPKRKEGDKQIPEGCYVVDRFNPKSLFHLSIGLNYPNASDLLLSDREKPGKDIFIHGRAKSIGCLAIGDPAIEELYVIAHDYSNAGGSPIAVHIFPGRMDAPAWIENSSVLRSENKTLATFWDDLRPIYDVFDQTKEVPSVAVAPDGRYRLRSDEPSGP